MKQFITFWSFAVILCCAEANAQIARLLMRNPNALKAAATVSVGAGSAYAFAKADASSLEYKVSARNADELLKLETKLIGQERRLASLVWSTNDAIYGF